MDYDDTDFQSQNFELRSEETNSNKFPSILRPFSLAKFEIEEHLSLNESETLFTIPNLSHSTNWIHDFSPQNSTIESCSISRNKNNPTNVWSEATSTESVEMLLNSVTEQDERTQNNNNNNNNMDGHDVHDVHDMDYSHIMDVDPSSSMLEESKSKSNVLEECITEQTPLEDSLGSTKFSRSSDGLLESITYPIRNLNTEMHDNYAIQNQFGNVNVGYPQMGKEISEEILNMGGVSEKSQAETESKESTEESDSAKIVDGTESVEVPKEIEPIDLSGLNNEGNLVNKETVLSEKDVVPSPVSLTGTSTGTGTDGSTVENADSLLKSQSAELAQSEEGLLASDTIKDQPSSDQIGGEAKQTVTVPDSIKSSDNTVLKEKESSIDPIEKPMDSLVPIDDSAPKEPVVQEEPGTDKQEIVAAPSIEENPPVTSETKLEQNVETNISSVEKEAPESNPSSDAPLTSDPVKENPNSTQPELTCGSPTIISCSQSCLEEEAKESGNNPSELATKEKSEEGSKETGDDKSFSFNVVASVAERESVTDWKPFPSLKAPKSPDIVAATKESSPSSIPPPPQNTTPPKSPTEPTEITKTPSKDSKSKAETPEPSQKKKRERKKTNPSSPLSPSPLSPPPLSTAPITPSAIRSELSKKHVGFFQEGSSKSGKSGKSKVMSQPSAASLPDLNASDSAAQQPFTDLQHVQLRAQIFVYGSLIQGVPPAEAYMASAFGDSDGGRAKWEGAWRTAIEKNQIPKSPSSAIETPTNSRSAQRTTESSAAKETTAKKKSSHTSSRAGTKSQPVSTPTVPALSSPALNPPNIPRGTQLDFTQSVPPLSPMYNPYQPLQIKSQPAPQSISPWLSPAPHSSPWGIKTGTPVSTVPTTTITTVEPSKMTPRRRTPHSSPVALPASSFAASPSLVTASPASSSVPVSPPDTQKTVPVQVPVQVQVQVSQAQNVTPPTQKTRKRKKASIAQKEPDNQPQVLPPLAPSPPQITSSPTVSPPILQSLTPPSIAPPKIIFAGQLASSPSLIPTPQPSNHALPGGSSSASLIPTDQPKSVSIFSEDANARIENSKLQAEEAAMHAAAAVKYSQGVWSHLSAHRNAGLSSDAELRLTSAAAAASAAASVAKAAALAAKLASEAALQAKIMAEEAIKSVQSGQGGQIGQGSFIAFAREAAKKRVEEASAAAKRAQNLDAVIKAAEVAAQAVSQAGVVVAMGDPLPMGINEMLDKGPEGFWKGYFGNLEKERAVVGGGGKSQLMLENREKEERVVGNLQMQRTEQGNESGDAAKAGNKEKAVFEQPKEILDGISKGSLIEVLADEAGLRGVWFGANVLDVEDNRVQVCYTDRFADEGLGQLNEWISVRAPTSDEPPRIRKAHPMTSGLRPDGTRKRRRDAAGSSIYAVGDHVDAWIRDGWRQGIITEKSDGDTKFTVQFQGAGGSSIVEAWNLRPTLIWKDNQWSIWARPHAKKSHPKESESPYEKRQRLGHLASDTNQAPTAETSNVSTKKAEIPRPFNLPTVNEESDEIFTVGKFTMGETKATRRTGTGTGTGSQKEGGSRVVFGVPKPGKKRKFMEVSKHFGEKSDKVMSSTSAREENPNPNPNPAGKSAHYSMPQNRAPKTKGKEAAEPKPSTGVKSIKSSSQNTHQNGSQNSSFDSLAEQRAPLSSLVGALKEKKKLEQDLGAKRKNVEIEVDHEKESNMDSSEPRRSNRRIQPTNRLLEGLQSSLILAKIPSDKGNRGGASKGASSKGRP